MADTSHAASQPSLSATPAAIARGRDQLIAWRSAQPSNWFAHHSALQHLLLLHRGADQTRDQRLGEYGAAMAGAEGLVHRSGAEPNTPVLERYDQLGRRHERVRFDGSYHEFGALVYGSGVMGLTGQSGKALEQAALVYLTSHHGEAGHVCPLACTAGLIKVIQQVGHPTLQRAVLPGLCAPDYKARLHGSQFLTEIQGGSDVGANGCTARPVRAETAAAPAMWAISGEKWFCSVVDAPLYLMTARPEGAPAGTKGLGLFVVPHDLPDTGPDASIHVPPLSHRLHETPNPVNHFRIRRLKQKLGTKAMASGEVDWDGALGWQLGQIDRGFAHVVEIVLNTSRLFNALACAGSMHRAFLEALGFATYREAFGQRVIDFASTRQSLGVLYAESVAALASTLDLIAADEAGVAPEAVRLGLNMNKYWTSVRNTQMVRLAMEVMGGNAAIEDFTPLPRLYRDAMVTESWEGGHNVLAAQTWRDMQKLKLHEAFLGWLDGRAALLTGRAGMQVRQDLAHLRQDADFLAQTRDPTGAIGVRVWLDNAAHTHQLLCLAELQAFQSAQGLPVLDDAVLSILVETRGRRRLVTDLGWFPSLS